MTDGPALPLLLVGPVTIDLIDGERLPGGPVCYGARVASAFGVRARVLTVAGPDADLTPLADHDVVVVQDPHTVTFEIDDRPTGRVMRVPHHPVRPMSADDLPSDWRTPRTLIVAPLLRDDVDVDSFAEMAGEAERVGVVTQGLQRKFDESGAMELAPPVDNDLVRTCSHSYSFFRSEREASLWTDEQVSATRQRGARLVTTQGERGAFIEGDERFEVPVFPTERVIDATGAGDVFATALILALDEGEQAAAQIAAAFAAASVETIGPAPLPSLSEIRRRLDAHDGVSDEQMRGARA